MSKTTWNILGILTILAGISMLSWMPDQFAALPADQRPKYLVGVVLLTSVLGVIATTCFFPKSRPITLRILGTLGAAGCLFNLVEGWQHHNFSQFGLILVFWLPGSVYLMLKGKMN